MRTIQLNKGTAVLLSIFVRIRVSYKPASREVVGKKKKKSKFIPNHTERIKEMDFFFLISPLRDLISSIINFSA